MTGICIWAHSKCRSTFGLYREVMRQAGVPVRIVLVKGVPGLRVAQGFATDEFADLPCEVVGDDWNAAQRILDETVGWVQVVCAYQVWRVGQQVMLQAHPRGDRVVVYSEAPCEMCVGVKAWAKRMYYRWVLPRKLRSVVACADRILNQSGTMGTERLMRLGWRREQIVPFGYACKALTRVAEMPPPSPAAAVRQPTTTPLPLRVLHLGIETAYRGVSVLEKAVDRQPFEVRRTKGAMTLEEVAAAIAWADVVVGCGLCEPWGMRINDAVMAGKPVIVSDGMGVAWMVQETGCGLVVPKGDAKALERSLKRCADDRDFLARLTSGAQRAAQTWAPGTRAAEFVRWVRG